LTELWAFYKNIAHLAGAFVSYGHISSFLNLIHLHMLSTKCLSFYYISSGKLGDEVLVSKHITEMKKEVSTLENQDKYFDELQKLLKKNEDSEKSTSDCGGSGSKTQSDEGSASISHIGNSSGEKGDKNDDNVYTLEKAMHEIGIVEGGLSEQAEQGADIKKEQTIVKDTQVLDDVIVSREDKLKCIEIDENSSKSIAHVKQLAQGSEGVSVDLKQKDQKPSGTESKNTAKTDYLMQLLDKRKNLLSKMADIQNVDVTKDTGQTTDNSRPDNSETKVHERRSSQQSAVQKVPFCDKSDTKLVCDVSDTDEIRVVEKDCSNARIQVLKTGTPVTQEAEESGRKGERKSRNTSRQVQQKSASLLQMISVCMKSWMTQETLELLQVDNSDSNAKGSGNAQKLDIDRQYAALVAKVDAQENDFDNLLGNILIFLIQVRKWMM